MKTNKKYLTKHSGALIVVAVFFLAVFVAIPTKTMYAQTTLWTPCTASINANPSSVTSNPASVLLQWDSEGCDSLTILTVGSVGPAGSRTISVPFNQTNSTSYCIYGADQVDGAQVKSIACTTVTYSPPQTATLNVNNTCAVSGGSWSISPGQLNQTSNTVNPSSGGTTYTISYTPPAGYTGSISPSSQIVYPGDTDTFTVGCIPHHVTVTMTPTPNPDQCSTGATISWSSTNANSCSAFWTSSTATSGSQAVKPSSSPQQYSMTCAGSYESGSDSVSITSSDAVNGSCVTPPPPPYTPAVSISTSPSTINSGQSSTITWSSSNVTSCSAWWTGSTAPSGSQVVSPVNTTQYPIQCTGPNGTVNNSTQVTVTKTQAVIFIYSNINQGGGIVSPGGLSGQGTGLSSYGYVTPDPVNGTTYTITPYTVPGYTFDHVEDGQTGAVGSSALLFPGGSKFFDVIYNRAPAGFNYSLSNSGATTITKGSSGQNSITETLVSGSSQPVSLSVSGAPSGVSITPSSCFPTSPTCTSVLTITVPAVTPVGDYTITVTGSPLSKTTNFILHVINSSAINVTCVPSPATALIGQNVTWTANASGGTAPYTYSWSGTNVPTNPAPSTSSFNITYSTIGQKLAQVTVNDSLSNSGSCNAPGGTILINFNPQFKEF